MNNKKLKNNFLISTFIIFTIGFLFHFVYEFTGDNFLVGLITPVNESVFEHLKLALFPILIWWITFYFIKRNQYFLDKDKWFFSMIISITIAILIVPCLYYFIKSGLNIDSAIFNIFLLYIAILIGQLIGYHFYEYGKKVKYLLSLSLIIIVIGLFIYLTINPPKLPLFKDEETSSYGIYKK